MRVQRKRHAGTAEVSDRARRCLSVREVLGSAPPLAEEGERVSGGEDSGARPAEGSIGLNSIWVKLTQRREEQHTLVGEVADARHAGEILNENNSKRELFLPVYLYFKLKRIAVDGVFFRASGDSTLVTRSWFDKIPKWSSLLGKQPKANFFPIFWGGTNNNLVGMVLQSSSVINKNLLYFINE